MQPLLLPVARERATAAGPPGTASVHPVRLPAQWLRPAQDGTGVPGLAEATAVCAVVLARHAGADGFVLPVLPAGPPARPAAVPVDLTGNPTFRQLLTHVRAALRSPRDPGGAPAGGGLGEPGPGSGLLPVRVTVCRGPDTDAADAGRLTLAVTAADGPKTAVLLAPPGTLRPDAAGRLAGHLGVLAAAAAAAPDAPVAGLPLLTAAEERLMLGEWNRTAADLPHDRCLHEHFQDRAAAQPEAVAVWEGGSPTTFAALNRRANRLARRLVGLGAAPGSVIGIALPRSADLLVSVLAVLKAGGCYLPMDPDYPAERLALLRRDGHCDAVLASAVTAAALPDGPGRVLLVDDTGDEPAEPADDLPRRAGPDDLCYVIHTSGTTGEPKGIELRHRGVVNNLTDLNGRFGVGPGDAVLALSSPGFDMSVYEFLGVTIAGGTVVVPDPEGVRRPAHWAELMRAHGVTVWNSAPALLELFVEHAERTGLRLPGLRLAMLGGDWIGVTLPDRLRALAPRVRVAALGGATESSIHSTLYEVPPTGRPDWPSVPYGRPLANQRLYILDPGGQPVPVGVPGELHLAGTGLARGYAGRPELTAERFWTWRHPAVGEERLYRTGDLARYHPDGLVELLGRLDFQVKISGVRVELGEIEHHLRQVPGVRHAVAVATGGRTGRQLVGYVVPRPGDTVRPEAVRAELAARLPAALVPGTVIVTDSLPLSPNGKVDRRRLAQAPPGPPGARSGRTAADGEPGRHDGHADPEEQRVAAVWAEVLQVPPPGPDADFFALGGDSFRAIRAMSALAPDLPPTELFRHPTVGALAARLRAVRQP
ncbi:non-ribosomal peptide synthetase [Streptomyces coeruleorubidus]|uniref:non-ribosomal peptide synthetase n=1 Tax=Streptomyces coeruleorubidus TaxID=116188 RepID=UPI003662B9F7